MPKLNDPRDYSPFDSAMPEESPEWSIRLGRLRGVTVSLSFTIFLAAAGLIAAVTASGSGGNAELPKAAAIGVSIWVTGWLLQLLACGVAAFVLGLRLRGLTIGLIGVELQPHAWTATRCLGWAIFTLGALVASGGLVWLWGGGDGLGGVSVSPWRAPSLGLSEADSIPHAAAWLLWIQAACQAFPLPGTLGRFALLSLVSIGFRELSIAGQAVLSRRLVKGLGVVVAFAAIGLIPIDAGVRFPRWILLLLLAVALWLSSRSRELSETVECFRLAADGADLREQGETVGERLRQWLLARRRRRRLVDVVREERQEAVDAARLDSILERLRRDGAGSLSDEERAVLRRVSERLRRIRGDQPR